MLNRRTMIGSLLAIPVFARAGLAQGPLSVVATTSMIADTARAIGGGAVSVNGLMGAGVDPHSYRQTRSDIAAMTRADLVLYNGLYLEAQLEDLLENLSRRLPVHAVGESVPKEALLHHPDYAGRADPHVWMVPRLWSHVAQAIRNAYLEQRDLEIFHETGAQYAMMLARLDDLARETLDTVPDHARVLITAHDAFGYFGRDYGFEVMGIQGISTQSEAGLARISELVDVIVTRRIRAVFVESSVSDRNIRALIEGAAARGHDLRIGGELYSDAMGAPGTYEAQYPGMIDHNVTTITRALGGSVPKTGLFGKLGAST